MEMTEDERTENQQKYLSRKLKRPTVCRICGKPVAPCYLPNKRLSSKRYHEDCIINSAIQSIAAGTKTMKTDPALKRAVSHGFTRTELLKIMEERNVENDRT